MTKRDFRDGDVIFLESDPGGEAYEVMKGAVELSRIGAKGRLRLALLNPGQTFGGKESLENGLRAATARAVGAAVVKVLPPPDDDNNGAPEKQEAGAASTGVFQRLFGALNLGARPGRIEVRVAILPGDVKEAAEEQTQHLVAALGGRRRLRARALKQTLPPGFGGNPAAVTALARQWLAEAGADLLIWGDIPRPGTTLHLKFVSAETEDEDIPGLFSPSTTLNLPVGFGPEFAALLLAVSLAATTPKDETKSRGLALLQEETLAAAIPVVKNLPRDLTTRERAAIHMCLGNAMARESARLGSSDLYQMAAQTYRKALEGMSREDSALDWALTHKHLGAVLQAMAERSGDEEVLNAAADAFSEALKELAKETDPFEWAATQNRLGMTLYKLDLISGDTELIKQALAAFQNALQVFSRANSPRLWAEALNNFAQAAQILGEQHRNPEVLEKAANACRSALEVRTKKSAPLQWAATQNNLGSALFLLGKLKKDLSPLTEAAEAFQKAHDFYKDHGAEKMAAIAKKNLSHAERLLEKHACPKKR